MTQRHDDSLDDFARGETAQVLARDRRTGELVFLAAGQAAAVRPEAREHFECPFPGCDSPAPLTTRGGTYRDHFVHMSPHTHPGGRESFDHFQAKHLIAAWARERAAADCIDVVVNDEEWSPDVRRRPDVLATWSDGRRVAFEVEYKAYPVAAWTEKNADYRRAGITVVWIFGHSPARYLRPDHRISGRRPQDAARGYRLGALTSAVVADGQPVLFINPVTGQIATLWSDGTPLDEARADPQWFQRLDLTEVGSPGRPVPKQKATFELAVTDLAECDLSPARGLTTPTIVLVDAESARVKAAADADSAAHKREMAARARAYVAHRMERTQWQARPVAVPVASGSHLCRVCRGPLAECLWALGIHTLC